MKGKQQLKRSNSTELYLFVGLELGQMTKWKWSLPGKVEVLKGLVLDDGQKVLKEKAKELRTNLVVQTLVQSEFEKSVNLNPKNRRMWSC
jgi:hypothetical protein